MSKFIVPSHKENKRLQALYPWSIAVFIVLLIASYFFAEGKLNGLSFFAVFAVSLYSVTQTIRKRAKEHFITINHKKIEWLLAEQDRKTSVQVSDIKWIKKEFSGTFTISRKSGYSVTFCLHPFPKEMQEQVIDEIQQMAVEQQLNLINFSEVPKVA